MLVGLCGPNSSFSSRSIHSVPTGGAGASSGEPGSGSGACQHAHPISYLDAWFQKCSKHAIKAAKQGLQHKQGLLKQDLTDTYVPPAGSSASKVM